MITRGAKEVNELVYRKVGKVIPFFVSWRVGFSGRYVRCDNIKTMFQFDEQEEKKKVSELYSQEAEALAQTLAGRYQLPYIDLSRFAINTDALRLVPEVEAREANLACFKITGRTLFVVIVSPNNPKTQGVLEELRNKNFVLNIYLGSEASLKRAWDRYAEISQSSRTEAGVIDIANDAITELLAKTKTLAEVQKLIVEEDAAARAGGGVSGLLEIILAGSLITLASDIHLEPQAEKVRLRYRLDGVLHDVSEFNPRLYQQLLSRVKLISDLKLNIKASAQDGRFSIRTGVGPVSPTGGEIEIRTSVLPGAYGESLVLRVLNPLAIQVTFETLGIEPKLFEIIAREIAKPNGLILLTGPTGSGKTTTLYAFLRRINDPGTKIITIEDTIEYHLTGVNQTQVNPEKNYTFLSGLRSALRQDPDVIMVGEIRDKETAKIAVNAALTGHLVFSTLHTNNAAGTIPRLTDLEVNPAVLDAAINIAIAQRLVRLLCPDCKRAVAPATAGAAQKLLAAVAASIRARRPDIVIPEKFELFEPVGCAACAGTGYRGRRGIFEAILIDESVAPLLVGHPNEREIKKVAAAQGLLDLRQDGVLKVLAGLTAFSELARVVDVNEEII